MLAPPTSAEITDSVVDCLLEYYNDYVLLSFYQTKAKGDNEKRQRAIEDDMWRYNDFPQMVRSRGEDEGLAKEELERLVRWKITHQTHRPFLLPQIRKNDPNNVKRCTAEARRLLLASTPGEPTTENVKEALNKVCELVGVGPATGTLILSVLDSKNVPFFEDELHAWLCPESTAKLKYNLKEYLEMLGMLREVQRKASFDKDAQHIEKVAFVCQHWDLVTGNHKETIQGLITRDLDDGQKQPADQEKRNDMIEENGHGLGEKTAVRVQKTESKTRPRERQTSGTKRKAAVGDTERLEARRSRRLQG